jgi:hypothetical protein
MSQFGLAERRQMPEEACGASNDLLEGGNSLLRALVRKRDFYAGTLLIVFGGIAVIEARQNPFGTLMHMGPGFFPTVLGVVLISLGVLIAGMSFGSLHEPDRILPAHPEWWGWACIIAGPIAFMVFGEYGGMAPATFACVFVSALGDRTATVKSSLLLALGITVFGCLLFSYVLHVPFPIFRQVWS